MIAKSDVIILVVSASTLAAGIYRWQSNMAMVSRAQTTISAPTATVINAARSTNVVANTAQPTASAPVSTSNASLANAATSNALTGAAATGNTTNIGTEIFNVSNGGSTTAATVVGNASQADSNSRTAEPLYGVYRVQSGDYLGKIAQTYGTTVDALRSINNITGSIIEIDQEILYPLPAN